MFSEYLSTSLVISRGEDNYFLCNSLEITEDSVIYSHALLFSNKALSDDCNMLENDKNNLQISLTDWRDTLITTPDIFNSKNKPWGYSDFQNRLLITIKINGNIHEILGNSVSITKDFFYISNPENYSFLGQYENIGYADDHTYRKPGYKWDTVIYPPPYRFEKTYCKYVEVDGIIEYQSASRKLIIPMYLLPKILMSIDSISSNLKAEGEIFTIKKERDFRKHKHYKNKGIELIKSYKALTLVKITEERFKEKDRAFSYSYDWFKTTKTSTYKKSFISDNRAAIAQKEIQEKIDDTALETFEIDGFDVSEHEITDWD